MSSDRVITTGGLDMTVIHGEEGAFVRLNGRLSIDTSPALRNRLLLMLQGESPEAVTIDLTEVPYIDCSGIATLIEALKIALSRKTTLRLRGLHGGLLHLLEVTGVLSLFEAGGRASAPSVSKVL